MRTKALVLTGLLAGAAAWTSCSGPGPAVVAKKSHPWSGTAVSLRVLQRRLAACIPSGACPATLLELAGLTRLDGVVRGADAADWILIGASEPSRPALRTEDFAVALRATWIRYGERRGDTIYYSSPGCSIDPQPDTIARLEQVSRQIDQDGDLEAWHAVCRRPQAVRVLGIPFDTHFAKVAVEADYFAKRLVDGSVTVSVPGVTSLSDRTMDVLRREIREQHRTTSGIPWMNRFEFVGGEAAYLKDEGIARLETCPVTLITEEEFLGRGGEIRGTGKAHPLAQAFARGFTENYAKIAEERPIYRELEGLFRHVAIAAILKEAAADAGLEYLLDTFPIPRTEVPRTVEGLSNVKRFEHRWRNGDIEHTLALRLPSCGGVQVNPAPKPVAARPSDGLREVRAAILAARPSPEDLAWTLASPAGAARSGKSGAP